MTAASLAGRRGHILRRLREFLFPAGTQRHRVLHAVRNRWRGGWLYSVQALFKSIRFRIRAHTLHAVIAPRDAKKILNILREEGPHALLRRAYSRVARVWRPHRRKHRPVYAIATAWGPLAFPESTAPTVSIIIPVYNNHLYTYTCLQSLLRSQPQRSYEVIVVDDCSTDATQVMLQAVQGVRIVRHDENQGFIRACNAGAGVARGQYILFLNNDTIVEPNWLDALAATFDAVSNVGLVGAKLIYPNGKLQEAGGIIWNDGSGWNYGRYDDPDKPEYSYLREVDYCSGACILLPKELYMELGGFDELYRPAYGEDVDLAFKVKQAGKKVLYQPCAKIVHFEGTSSGTDPSKGVKSYQSVNQGKFFQKWARVLVGHAAPGDRPHLERERGVTKRVLVVDAYTPTPDQDSGSLRIIDLIRVLQSLGYQVTFVADYLEYDDRYTPPLQRQGVQCLYWPYTRSIEEHLRSEGEKYDLILSCRPDVTEKYLKIYRQYAPRAKVLYETVDLHYVREQRQADIEGRNDLVEQAQKRKVQELRLVESVDCTIVVSEWERQILLKQCPETKVVVVSNAHDLSSFERGFGERHDLCFLGGYQHPPNVDAAEYLVREIFTLVRLKLPGVKLYIIGSRPPESILRLASNDIVVTGYVPNLVEYMSRCKVSVNPLRFGAGVKGKILTSMAYGVPCVGTSVCFEGMGFEDGREVLVADHPAQFVDAIVDLYQDEQLWTTISKNGRSALASRYSIETTKKQVQAIVSHFQTISVGGVSEKSHEAHVGPPPSALDRMVRRDQGKGHLDIGFLVKESGHFGHRLEQLKAQVSLNGKGWYPYGTLNNLWVLDKLLAGSNRDLVNLIGNGVVADIGAADGDMAFFLDSLGVDAEIIDHAQTNFNGLCGARALKQALTSKVPIHDLDLDDTFKLPHARYGLIFFLGILYHLKNPYYALEHLAQATSYCLISTRTTKYTAGRTTNIGEAAVAYLLDAGEANNDPTNYWVFTEKGLRRILKRTGWNVVDLIKVGNTRRSDPASTEGDERTFVLAKSMAL